MLRSSLLILIRSPENLPILIGKNGISFSGRERERVVDLVVVFVDRRRDFCRLFLHKRDDICPSSDSRCVTTSGGIIVILKTTRQRLREGYNCHLSRFFLKFDQRKPGGNPLPLFIFIFGIL